MGSEMCIRDSPLSHLICKAKTTTLSEEEVDALNALTRQTAELAHSSQTGSYDLFSSDEWESGRTKLPEHKAIEFWFEPFIANELAEILALCNALSSDNCRTIAKISFSAIVVAVSKQDSDTRYVRKTKNLEPGVVSVSYTHLTLPTIYSV